LLIITSNITQTIKKIVNTMKTIYINFFLKTSFILCMLFCIQINQAQIEYNWQNSKEGWISGGDCNLTAQPDAMAMRLFSPTGKMISGTATANLGIFGGDYNKVDITVKNPTTGSGIARLFIYPPGAANNNDTCYYAFQVDTAMTSFATYTIDLDSIPSGGVGSVYTGPIARFGLRAPWGGANFDTIFWKKMVVYNTNQPNDSVSITFNVDMSQVSNPFTTPEINGDFNAWCGNCNPLTDSNGDNIWETELKFKSNDSIEYRFSADSWSIQENMDPSGICTNGNINFTNRTLTIPSNDSILNVVCWESCDPCVSTIPQLEFSMSIYPNPANQSIRIKSNERIEKLILRDLTGRIIVSKHTITNDFSIDISSLENNIYFLECRINNHWEKTKLVVSH
tara:strand:- start:4083 stop:5270 length:1188 start_codon:yes stop_codon:yes gene_type:complete